MSICNNMKLQQSSPNSNQSSPSQKQEHLMSPSGVPGKKNEQQSKQQFSGENWRNSHHHENNNKVADDKSFDTARRKSDDNRRRTHWHGNKKRNEKKAEDTSRSKQSNIRDRGEGVHGRGGSNNNARVSNNYPGRIPDRWLQYTIAIHQPMESTRFMAFKTPLRREFFELEEYRADQDSCFGVIHVMQHINGIDHKLGMVIDLTNTNRYYDATLWNEHEVKYTKIRCPGHEVNSDENLYSSFSNVVKKFLDENAENGKLIGVHCTHGLNRTGYLICRYLIEEQCWTAKQAIDAFEAARGYPIERPAYIKSLHEIENRIGSLKLAEDDE